MRYVYWPVISARNVSAAPSYNFWQSFRRHALEIDPDAVFYVLVPKVEEGSGWQEGADWSGPRTHVLEIPHYRSQYDELSLASRDIWERFNERFGDLFFDVFLTERPITAPMVRRMTSFHNRGKSRKPLVITRDQFVQSYKWDKIDPIVEAQQALGWSSGPTVFQSDHQLKVAQQMALAHLRPSWVQEMVKQARVFPLGIDCADVDRENMAEREQKNRKLTINYSHKLFGQQFFLASLEIMDKVLAGGRKVQLQIVTGSSEGKLSMVKQARKYRYIQTFGGANRRTFLKQMAKAHIFVSNSVYEDFSATVAEQLYTGLIPVMLDAEWSRYLVGPEYPYLFKNPAEGQAMLRYVVDNYAEVWSQWSPVLQRRMKDQFDLHTIVPNMVRWMQELVASGRAENRTATSGMRELVEKAYAVLPDEFDQKDFYAAIRKTSNSVDVERDAEGNSTSKWLLVDILLEQHPELTDLGGEQISWHK